MLSISEKSFIPSWSARSCRVTSDAKAVAVEVFHIHLARTPGHVCGRKADDSAALLVLLIKEVNIFSENGHPHTGLPLRALTEKDFDIAASDTTKSRRIAPVPLLAEAQLVNVVVD